MDHDSDSMNQHRARRRRVGAAMVGLAAVALLATACGGGPESPGVASVGRTTTATPSASGSLGASGSTTTARPAPSRGPSSSSGSTTTTVAPSGSSGSGSSEDASQSQLQFAQCMRAHGEPEFPDPSPGGGFLNAISASGINAQSPTYQAALQACKKYTPAGNMTPAQSAADDADGLRFSQCIRAHGVPNYPDPSTGPAGEQAIDLRGRGIDLRSPTFQAANKACQKIVPGSK
jgi:hypothetical protein